MLVSGRSAALGDRAATISIYPVAGGQPKALAASYDGQPNVAGWSADGKRIYFSEAKGTGTQIYAIDVGGEPNQRN